MDAAAELGKNPVSKHQIQPEYGDEQADAGRDYRTRLARPNSWARTGTGKYSFFLSSSPRAGLATIYPVDSYSCYSICDDHRISTIRYCSKIQIMVMMLRFNDGHKSYVTVSACLALLCPNNRG